MILITSDGKRIVDVGTSDIWTSLYSTVVIRLRKVHENIPLALKLFKDGKCLPENATKTARQINLIRDSLASVRVDEIVYDMNKKIPWLEDVSSIVTSAGNFYITADGKDLLFEIVSILTYAGIMNVMVESAD